MSTNTAASPFFCLPNLSASLASRNGPPWEMDMKGLLPRVANKSEYKAWSKNKATEGSFFSMVEGQTPSRRVHSKDNPPVKIHGLVGDYDGLVVAAGSDEIDLAELEPRLPAENRPSYVGVTFSKGARVVWLFEEPVLAGSADMVKHFYETARKALTPERLYPGMDTEAWGRAAQYYANYGGWKQVGGLIRKETTRSWALKAGGERGLWDGAGKIHVPLQKVGEEIERRWPGGWGGGWEPGARGNRFWDNGDANSVVLREGGFQCFTGERAFISWAELLGREFVSRMEEDRLGKMAARYKFQYPNTYWWLSEEDDRTWQTVTKSDFLLRLRAMGFGGRVAKGSHVSDLEETLLKFQNTHYVHKAFPLIGIRPVVLHRQKPEGGVERVLNTQTRFPTLPADPGSVGAGWGKGFPHIAWIIEGLLQGGPGFEPFDIFNAWVARAYKMLINPDASYNKGQVMILAGPVEAGKTFLSEKILSPLLGGCAPADQWIYQESIFNKELIQAPLWTLDDPKGANSYKQQTEISEKLKKIVANHTLMFNAKYQDSVPVEWCGRIILNCNDHSESLRALPNLELSNRDKVIMIRTGQVVWDAPPYEEGRWRNPGNGAFSEAVKKEVPFYGRWLLDTGTPAGCYGSGRFEVKSYHSQELLDEVREQSETYAFEELLLKFVHERIKANPKETQWRGPSCNLIAQMNEIEGIRGQLRDNNMAGTRTIGKLLGKMREQGNEWVKRSETKTKRGFIYVVDYLKMADDLASLQEAEKTSAP